ncbi:hypothetical protein NUSPORA_00497 [Nucleospora cyclopteri]
MISSLYLVRFENKEENFQSEILQVPSSIDKDQLKKLINADKNVTLYVNGNMIHSTLSNSLKEDVDPEEVKIIKMVKSKGSVPAVFCNSAYSGHQGPVLKLLQCESKGKSLLITAGADKTVRFWDTVTKTQFKTSISHSHWVLCLVKHKEFIVSGGMDSLICIHDLEGNLIKTIKKQRQGISVLLQTDNAFIAGARDGTIVFYNNQGETLATTRHNKAITAAAASTEMLVTAGKDGSVKQYVIQRENNQVIGVKYVCELQNTNSAVNCVKIFRNYAVTGDDMGNVTVYQLNEGILSPKFRLKHKREVMEISFDPNGFNFVTCSFDKTVKGWNLESGKNIFTYFHVNFVYKVKYLNDLVISAGKDKAIKFYRPSEKKVVSDLITDDEIYDIAYENGQLYAGLKNSKVYFYS